MRVATFITFLLLAGSACAANPQSITLDVQNMSCRACPITVRKALEKVPGVTDAKIDFDRKTATVRYDQDKVNSDELTRATTDAGYPSTVGK